MKLSIIVLLALLGVTEATKLDASRMVEPPSKPASKEDHDTENLKEGEDKVADIKNAGALQAKVEGEAAAAAATAAALAKQ